MNVVNHNWKTVLMFIHRIEFILSFKDRSCKIMRADNIKLWWRKYVLNEASFHSSHVLGGFALCPWFRTSVFSSSSQRIFIGFGKCLKKHNFWTPTDDNYSKNLFETKMKLHFGTKLIWQEPSCISFTRINIFQDRTDVLM